MAHRQRRRRFDRKPRSAVIPAERCIAARPIHVGSRQEFGHWEADLVIFARSAGGGNLTALQERQSRFLILIANHDKRSNTVIPGITTVLDTLPADARRGITFDRGTEFLGYKSLPAPAWFCDPHSPWQKGGIENANGRLRRHLPLESPAADRSHELLSNLANLC